MPGAWEHVPPSVMIGIIHTGIASVPWGLRLAEMQKPPGTLIRAWEGLPYDKARNKLVVDAKRFGVRKLFLLDSDVLPPRYVIPSLDYLQAPIVSGLYWSKRGYPAMWKRDASGKLYNPIVEWDKNTSVLDVDAVGAGCMLIDMRVFDRLKPPWFVWEIDDPENPGEQVSEDFHFCNYAQSEGFKILVHLGIKCHHEGRVAMDTDGHFSMEASKP